MTSKQDTKKISEWKAENITRVLIEVKKDSGLIDRLEIAKAKTGKSRQAYIIEAITEKLDRDGIA